MSKSQALLLPSWRKAKAAVKAGVANGRIVVIGDSTTFGANAAGAWTKPNITDSLSSALTAQGIKSTADSFAGMSVPGATQGSRFRTDTRLVQGSWTSTGAGGAGTLGGAFFSVASGATALQFTPYSQSDTFNFFYGAYTGEGIVTLQATGGSFLPVNGSTPPNNSLNVATVTAGSLGNNTLSATYTSGATFYGYGIEAYNSAVKSINIFNAGYWGTTTGSWTNNGSFYSPIQMAQYIAPALTIIIPGINDWGGSIAIPTFTANVQILITAAKATGDVILVTPTPNTTNLSIQPNYISALYGLAQTNNCPIIDNYGRWVSFSVSNPLGFYSDALHPTAIGYEDQAQQIANLLVAA